MKSQHGIAQKAFLYHLYDLFRAFISSPPRIQTRIDKCNGKEYQSIEVQTLSYVCFKFFQDRFYVKSPSGTWTQIVPSTIGDYLDAVALAYWIMCDGYQHSSGPILCTDSFTLKEVQLLIKASLILV